MSSFIPNVIQILQTHQDLMYVLNVSTFHIKVKYKRIILWKEYT